MPNVRHRGSLASVFDDATLVRKPRKAVPHAFVLEALTTLSPATRPMFAVSRSISGTRSSSSSETSSTLLPTTACGSRRRRRIT